MVMDEDNQWLDGEDEAPKVFFIMTGRYQVKNLFYKMKKKI